jgi:anti-sigma B factor antagonist
MTDGPLEFSISEDSDGDAVVLRLQGELDVMVAAQLRQVICAHLAERRHQIVDLSEVTFIDSTGLAAIVKSAATPEDRELITLRRSRHHQANRLFALTGTDQLFQFVPDADSVDTDGAGSPKGAGSPEGASA